MADSVRDVNSKIFWGFVFLGLSGNCSAQNLIKNGSFDMDISNWSANLDVYWDGAHNFPQSLSDHGGSIMLATEGASEAAQCVAVPSGTAIYASVSVKYDAEDQTDRCPEPGLWGVTVNQYTNASCIAATAGVSFLNGGFTDGWQVAFQGELPSKESSYVSVALYAACQGDHHGKTIVYFDDIVVYADEIFKDSFE